MSEIKFETLSANPNIDNVKDVEPDEVLKRQDEVQLIDVRRPDEYTGELGHIKGSTLLTLDFLPQKINELSKDKPIVFICRSGMRSAQACGFALENGFSEVYNMRGGMLLWNEKNFAVEEKN